ncbi:putative membrane protein [Bradyrhizobium sp. BR13661]|jgi:hypothetical protein|nr:putative membrane protein [Bradyrhizobium sp. BR13661]
MPVISILIVVLITFALLMTYTTFGPQRVGAVRRTLVFSVLGPALCVASAVLIELAAGRVPEEGVVYAFLFSLIVSIITGPIDGYLAHFIPLQLRAPLSAIVGAATVWFLLFSLTRLTRQYMTAGEWTLVLSGALCMGVCSLLSGPSRDEAS